MKRNYTLVAYILMELLHIFLTDIQAPASTHVPSSLSRQILDHDAAQYYNLCFNAVEDAMV